VVIFPKWDDLIDQEGTKILGVSDGGHKDDYGSFGWAIATDMEPKTNLVQNNGLARGQPMSSHRAEAYGRISILLFLGRYAEYRGKPYSTSLQAITYCDNSGVLTTEKRLKRGVESPYRQLNPDHDALVTIAELSAKLPENFRTKHVHGHQDNALEYEELSPPAQLNVDADELATIALQSALAEGATALQTIPLPSCQAYLLNREGCIISSGEVKHHLRLSMPAENLMNYLQRHQGWTDDTIHRINWELFAKGRAKLTPNLMFFSTKLSSDWLPVAVRQHRHQFLPTNECHLCGEPEITEHLFLCKQRGEWKQSFLANIDKELRRLETAADIRRHIVQGLEDWLFTKATELISVDQDAIGWYNIA